MIPNHELQVDEDEEEESEEDEAYTEGEDCVGIDISMNGEKF